MAFQSYEFIFVFMPVVAVIYFMFDRHHKAGNIFLLACSILFYGLYGLEALPVLFASVLINYLFGLLLTRYKNNKSILFFGLAFNILLLCFYKYKGFLIDNINYLTGANFSVPALQNLVIPAGVSFFTITQIVFLVDCYQGVTSEKNILEYALFVTFFPHILSGPIYQHKNIAKQLRDPELHKTNWENIAKGITLFAIGMAKKVIIADSFSKYVAQAFENSFGLTLIEAWLAAICFTIQLYFDFSGYSDMAVGIAQIFNIKIPVNFNSPYKAYGIIEFWSRWHISLTNTITNYIYTPIVMSFKKITFAKAMFATFLAMLIAGVWHGAGWTFIIFGALHGVGLVLNHVWKKYKLFMWRPLGYLLTGLLILVANVFFRAESVKNALEVFYAMLGMNGVSILESIEGTSSMRLARITQKFAELVGLNYEPALILLRFTPTLILGLGIIFLFPNSNKIVNKLKISCMSIISIILLVIISCYFLDNNVEFVYFQF